MRETRLEKGFPHTLEYVYLGVVTLLPDTIINPLISLSSSTLLKVLSMGSETNPESRLSTFLASFAVSHLLEKESRGAERSRRGRRDSRLGSCCDFQNGHFIFHPKVFLECQMLC